METNDEIKNRIIKVSTDHTMGRLEELIDLYDLLENQTIELSFNFRGDTEMLRKRIKMIMDMVQNKEDMDKELLTVCLSVKRKIKAVLEDYLTKI